MHINILSNNKYLIIVIYSDKISNNLVNHILLQIANIISASLREIYNIIANNINNNYELISNLTDHFYEKFGKLHEGLFLILFVFYSNCIFNKCILFF